MSGWGTLRGTHPHIRELTRGRTIGPTKRKRKRKYIKEKEKEILPV